MKLSIASLFLVALSGIEAFAPAGHGAFGTRKHVGTTARSAVDPSFFHEVPHHFDSLRDVLPSLTLSDIDADSVGAAVGGAVDAASTAVAPDAVAGATTDAAAAASSNGWFGFLTVPIEGLLDLIHSGLVAVGLPANTWGISIVAMTVLIKTVTFPLTKTQLESTNKMQVGLDMFVSVLLHSLTRLI